MGVIHVVGRDSGRISGGSRPIAGDIRFLWEGSRPIAVGDSRSIWDGTRPLAGEGYPSL